MKNKLICYLNFLFPDPKCELNYNKDYELLIAVMLSAQTTDKRVNIVTKILFDKYNSLKALSEANISDLEGIVRPLGCYIRKSENIRQIASKLLLVGNVPNDSNYLKSLPGIGIKTSNVILNILYNYNNFAVDTHVKRVSIRLGIVNGDDELIDIENKLLKYFKKDNINRISLQFVLFGRYHCMARKPKCKNCELKEICKYKKRNE